jgi:2,3-bisphosphoglycerate-dependent phosphoglycerate mutase
MMNLISAGVLQASPGPRVAMGGQTQTGPRVQYEQPGQPGDSVLILPSTSHIIAPASLIGAPHLILPRGVDGAVAAGVARSPGVLVLLRHGQSVSNLEKRFTGSLNAPLTDLGRRQAVAAGKAMGLNGLQFDVVFTSDLDRAQDTGLLALDGMGQHGTVVIADAALNERFYGDIQGEKRDEMAEKFGAEQMAKWRHDYYEKPPGGESIAETADRVMPYYEHNIKPLLAAGYNVLIAAHCDSLRPFLVQLEGISVHDEASYFLNATPLIYHYDHNMNVVSRDIIHPET